MGFALAALVVGVAGAWIPSLWTDEVATLNAVSRTWDQWWSLLGRVDAVHGTYEAIVKAWVGIWGSSPLALRIPSAIAAAIAVLLTVRLAQITAGLRIAVAAGILAVVVPAIPAAAIDARPGAFVTAAAVAASLLLVRALRDGGAWWVGYGAAVVATGAFSVVALSLLSAHAVTVVWTTRRRSTLLAWAAAAGGAVAVLAPLLVAGSRQVGQVSWIPDFTAFRFVGTYAAAAWFDEVIVVGVLFWLLIVISVLFRKRTEQAWAGSPSLMAVALPWLVLPGIAMAIVSILGPNVFVPRYLAFCAPAAALAAAAGAMALTKPVRWAALAAIVVAGTYVGVQQRLPTGAENSDWAIAAHEVASRADSGDAVVFWPDGGEPRSPRRALEAYPDQFADLADIGLVATGPQRGALWGIGRPIEDDLDEMTDPTWVLVSRVSFSPERAAAEFSRLGLSATLMWSGPSTLLYEVTAPAG